MSTWYLYNQGQTRNHTHLFPSQPTYLLRPLLEALLPLSAVPLQRPGNTIDPILAPSIQRQDARKGEPRGADGDVVARLELHAFFPVEARPRAGARVVGDAGAQDDGVGQDDGAEGEGVRADGGDQDDGVVRVAQGAAGGEVVRGAARGRRDADAVGLDGGEVFVVAEELDAGHGGVGSAVDDDLVEDVVRAVGPVRVVVFAFFADELLDEVAGGGLAASLRPHDGGFEAEA